LHPGFRNRLNILSNSFGSDESLDNFIRDFGTHYRQSATFGGAYGVDYYFTGFGTERDNAGALHHVVHADLRVCFDLAARGLELSTPEFRGFGDSKVFCNPWNAGGSSAAMSRSFSEWEASVLDNSVVIKENLITITDLMKVMGVSPVIQSKFADRIVKRAQQSMRRRNTCMFVHCQKGFTCMMDHCIPHPVPPTWPDAVSYCLPKPQGEECPSSYNEFWPGSWVYWDTENGDDFLYYAGHDHITSHGLEQYQVNAKREFNMNGGLKLFFCCVRPQPSRDTKWPAGTYCLYAHRYVSMLADPAWEYISIVWNDEDEDNQNARSQPHDVYSKLPMGRYDNYSSFTEQTLLCRSDGPQSRAIVLPKSKPFYLVQHGGICQEVWGMYWTHVQVTWDTENDHKSDDELVRWNRLEKIPRNCKQVCEDNCNPDDDDDEEDFCYVGHDKIVVDFCYYQEKDTPSPTPKSNTKSNTKPCTSNTQPCFSNTSTYNNATDRSTNSSTN
jgi:hypothetical protein